MIVYACSEQASATSGAAWSGLWRSGLRPRRLATLEELRHLSLKAIQARTHPPAWLCRGERAPGLMGSGPLSMIQPGRSCVRMGGPAIVLVAGCDPRPARNLEP